MAEKTNKREAKPWALAYPDGKGLEGEYEVQVTYVPMPSYCRLATEFAGVTVLLAGHEWKCHPSCQNIDVTPGTRTFLVRRAQGWLIDMNGNRSRAASASGNIRDMDKLGWRPSTHQEAYEFQRAYPKLQCKAWIVALGSYTHDMGANYALVLNGDPDGQRRLGACDPDGKLNGLYYCWDAGVDYFLFVRKDEKK